MARNTKRGQATAPRSQPVSPPRRQAEWAASSPGQETEDESTSDIIPQDEEGLGGYRRLVTRLQEALVLSHALGKTRAEHTKAARDGSLTSRRKELLNDLAYVCDFDKGGKTTTAIAVESTPGEFVFWFARNKVARKVALFLESVLQKLKEALLTQSGRDDGGTRRALVQNLTDLCFSHAQNRIETEIGFLHNRIDDCLQHLTDEKSLGAIKLLSWLRRLLNTPDTKQVCLLAYEQRRGSMMDELLTRGRQGHFISKQSDDKKDDDRKWDNPFYAVHHIIGRLACHIKAPARLVANADCLQEVLGSDFVVRQADGPRAMPGPKISQRSKLEPMLNKLGLPDNQDRQRYMTALVHLDMQFDIQGRVEREIQRNSKPTVHAEIKLLDLFHREKKIFYNNFRFIGCSKPACYCCKVYIRCHPAGLIEPDSHENVWLSWSPPAPPTGTEMHKSHYLHSTLQRMVEKVGKDALDQIVACRDPLPWQFDSTTGITQLDAVQQGFGQIALHQKDPWRVKAVGDDGLGDSSDLENASLTESPGSSGSSSAREVSSSPGSSHRSPMSPTGRLLAGTGPDMSSSDSDNDDGGGVLLFGGRR